MCHTQKRKGHLHYLIQPGSWYRCPSTTGQMGGKNSISMDKEHITGDDDRLA